MRSFAHLLVFRLVQLIGQLPLAWARRLGAACGVAALWLNTPMVKLTRSNIALCLPELTPQQQTLLVKQSVVQTCTLACEAAVVWHMDTPVFEASIQGVQGLQHLERAQAAGKGVIVLAPHLGNWEVFGLYLARFGQPVYLFQPPRMKRLGQLIRSRREKLGAQLVPTNRKGLATLLACLKAGGVSGVLPDQAPKEAASGIAAPFFGQPAFTMTLAHKLMQNSGCQAVFGYAERCQQGFIIHFLPAPEDLYSPDAFTAAKTLNAGVETCVRQCLPQYQWEYRRFRSTFL